jgi:LacI family transcriptional regulator
MTASRATLQDVARLAGVSLGSASRALSVPGRVKPDTLERVNRAVQQLGYVRNGAAQALALRRTRMVATVYPTLGNPIFAESIHALEQTLWKLGYQLLVASHDYEPERESDVLRGIVERGVDGVVLVGTDHSEDVFALIRRHDLPCVLTWSLDEGQQRDCVGFSYFDAAYRMARLVVEYGHTRIALCVGHSTRNERVRARVAGTRAALRESGIDLPPERILEEDFSYDGGMRAVRAIAELSPRPTVLVCGNDVLAIGAIGECRRLGLRVPEDLSITGADDIEIAALIEPALTTLRVPTVEIGERAARRIVSLIAREEITDEPELQATVVVRDSLRRIGPGARARVRSEGTPAVAPAALSRAD